MRVAVVLVAFNRETLLQESLDALAGQTRRPDRLIVVNNASTDNSGRVAENAISTWDDARLINLTENTGGAGGFAVGIAAAVTDPTIDWVWVMDDDTVPHETALEEALAAHQRYAAIGDDNLAVMGSRVVWTDGDDHPMNTPKPKIGAGVIERQRASQAGAMEIRSISFVSAFLRASRVREVGLPLADYFLWNDDFEYSARMLRGARGLFVPQSVVTHKTKVKGSSDQDPGERFYFEVRNKLWVFRNSHALKPWERAAYRAASVRRWIRTFRASEHPEVLKDCLKRGLADAREAGPRPTPMVLADAGVPDDVFATVIDVCAKERSR